ncbi:MAG: aminotransferase class III-fold pyridoxal phosphate-dependent enzyme [Gemmatimonadota bacterium]
MIRTHPRLPIDADTAAEVVRTGYGLEGRLRSLPGERDRNFLVHTAEGGRYVAKFAPPGESEEQLAFEIRLQSWLSTRMPSRIPGVLQASDGSSLFRHQAPEGPPWRVRVLDYLEGRVLADVRPRSVRLLNDVGRCTAQLGQVLADHDEPSPLREDFVWALAEAPSVMERGLDLHLDDNRRRLVAACLEEARRVEPAVALLERQLIHGDLNDHNILVSPDEAPATMVSGILDLGDAHPAPAVFDLAIAAAYAVLDQSDALQAAAQVVAGYHAVRPLTEAELDVLFPLLRARLAASVTISASRRSPDQEVDEYHLVSEAPAWTFLERTHDIPANLARGFLRQACGLPACPRSSALVTAIRNLGEVVPVMDMPDAPGTVVLDLSVGSPDLTGRDTDDAAAFTRRVFEAMDRLGAKVGLGRYREPRGFYLSEAFEGRPSEMPERRTVHMGIDIFDDPGAEVRAPLTSVVASVRDNAARLDYGPTVILEHETPAGRFWTLYGHLERASVELLEEGRMLSAGEPFARVGPRPENGDWPPHLHFQIITDLLGSAGDFPGVAAPRELAVWESFSPDPNLLLRQPLATTYAEPTGLLDRRRRLLGPNLSLSYDVPIHVVRGVGTYLYDHWGRQYLDCVNNVAHVGHEHPHVVRAGRRQMGVLNTNTRYLHERVLDYAERLLGCFPQPLEVCFFVNSGSEANELALRLARTATGREGLVVLEGGYHGNTRGLVDVSHYKFSGRGGRGAPSWVRAARLPDDYRGPYRRDDPRRAERYAAHVRSSLEELADAGAPASAFLCESLLSCGGQIEPPAGYLPATYGHARDAGALCIADEVQVGFGRVGTHMWGFQTQGVVPDVVTLGKPMGNGHPLGAVVTTRAIADGFDNGMEFFSTYGGNPVSAAIGLAVMEVLEREELQAHADDVGRRLKEDLLGLMDRHGAIGDVRGRGLFLGVELVVDRDTRIPDAAAARYIVGRMKERGVLLSTDGPDENVIKIKPPLPFSLRDVDQLVTSLDDVLGEDAVRR